MTGIGIPIPFKQSSKTRGRDAAVQSCPRNWNRLFAYPFTADSMDAPVSCLWEEQGRPFDVSRQCGHNRIKGRPGCISILTKEGYPWRKKI